MKRYQVRVRNRDLDMHVRESSPIFEAPNKESALATARTYISVIRQLAGRRDGKLIKLNWTLQEVPE